ncbi:MAG TPA: penicillin-binding protein 1A [Spongiibacteraceae bacterium]|nr:penicillin-binding protein 1A [Spongiibacteraceae bacterium]
MPKIKWLYRILCWLVVLASAAITLVGAGVFLYLSPNLPSVDVLRDVQLQTPLRVYTSDGELIGEFGEMRRTPVKLAELPPLFIKAVLAAEDDNFYQHHGVDVKSLMRAASQLLASGHIQTGGSTITMQVAKNYFLTQERTFSRKFHEILLALQIERELSKDDILELYVNKIFLGNRAYGVEAAAQVYYGKSIDELSLSQWAMIAGLPKAPSANNPIAKPERAVQRRNWILGRMLSLGYIDHAQYQAATAEPLAASYHGSVLGLEANHAAEMARQEMVQRFGLKAYTDGYVAYTTLDSKLQRTANNAVIDGLLAYDQRHGYRGAELRLKDGDQTLWLRKLRTLSEINGLQAAAVSTIEPRAFTALLADGRTISVDWSSGLGEMRRYVDEDHRGPAPQTASDIVAVGDVVRVRRTAKGLWELRQIPVLESALICLNADDGAVLTLVGGFNFQHSKFNRATQAERQPGSGFKPFIYTAALEHGFTPASIINDAPIVFQDDQMENAWRPVNDTGKFYGPTPLRTALFKSRNVVSIRVLQQIGVDTAVNYVERFGFDKSKIPRNLSIALGSLSVTPMQMVKGFAVFANGGYRIEPYVLQRVLDRNGEVIYQANPAVACPTCANTGRFATRSSDTTEPGADPQAIATTADAPAPINSAAPAPTMAPQVLDKRYAFIMDTMLHDVVSRGTAEAAAGLGRGDLAGKTGTTSGPVDTWFTGYAGGIVTTAWAGFDQNKLMGRKEYGATIALPIWMDFMRTALAGRPERHFKQPEGVVSLRIDPHTGQQARADQPDATFEYFTEDNLPGQEGPDSSPGNSAAPPANGMSVQDLF